MHTPGPWKYTMNVGPTKALIVETDGSTVVEIGNRTHDSRFLPNTRLIAAAPDLLEALRGMEKASEEIAVEFIERKRATNWAVVNDAYVAAARAIAKAEGR